MNKGVTFIGSIGAGAGLMYLLDPDRGERRRALLRDRIIHWWHRSAEGMETTATDLANRTRGLAAETTSRFRAEQVTDEVLVERVRAKMGRVVSHPRAISVAAHQGRVTLSGPILADEVGGLLKAVASVRGVHGVDNQLEVHQTAEGVPSLQGGRARPIDAQANWSPTARLLAGVAGSAMTAYCVGRRDAMGAAVGTVGMGLLARSIANKEVKRLVGLDGGRGAVDFQKTINVNAPLEDVFNFWSGYENFPRFMSRVREVRDLGGGRSHWVVAGPAGVPVEWDADLIEYVPNGVISWRSAPGAAIAQEGRIHFEPNADGTTRIDIKMSYSPPGGAMGHAVADMLGANPKQMMDEDLARMKTLIETGNPPRDAAQAA